MYILLYYTWCEPTYVCTACTHTIVYLHVCTVICVLQICTSVCVYVNWSVGVHVAGMVMPKMIGSGVIVETT